MARAIIENYSEDVVVKEKVLGFIPYSTKFTHYYLLVRKPDSSESKYYLVKEKHCVDKNGKLYQELVGISLDKYKSLRTAKIQEIINQLEKEGYKVENSQLALFMNLKIDTLIINSNK